MPIKKGGRPRLPEDQKKTYKVSVMLNEIERKEFEESYKRSGYRSQNRFVISCTTSENGGAALSPVELELISEVRIALSEILDQQRRIGNNFNQLMHLAQGAKELPQAKELKAVETGFHALEEKAKLYFELIKALKEKWSLR